MFLLFEVNSSVFSSHRCNIVFLLSKATDYSFIEVFFALCLVTDATSSFLMLVLVAAIHFMSSDCWLSIHVGDTKKHVRSSLLMDGPHCRVIAGASSFIGGC